jgi:hypothetical protein
VPHPVLVVLHLGEEVLLVCGSGPDMTSGGGHESDDQQQEESGADEQPPAGQSWPGQVRAHDPGDGRLLGRHELAVLQAVAGRDHLRGRRSLVLSVHAGSIPPGRWLSGQAGQEVPDSSSGGFSS